MPPIPTQAQGELGAEVPERTATSWLDVHIMKEEHVLW